MAHRILRAGGMGREPQGSVGKGAGAGSGVHAGADRFHHHESRAVYDPAAVRTAGEKGESRVGG